MNFKEACKRGDLEAMKICIHLNKRNLVGRPSRDALMEATLGGRIEVVKLLFESFAGLEIPHRDGQYVELLEVACRRGDLELAELFGGTYIYTPQQFEDLYATMLAENHLTIADWLNETFKLGHEQQQPLIKSAAKHS